MLLTATVVVCVAAVIWIAWRVLSKRAVLPCPAELHWLVEVENPLARATRSGRVVEQLSPQSGDRVMDVGCGPGRVTIPLARAVGPDGIVIALDVQAEMLAKVASKAKSEGLANVQVLRAELCDDVVDRGSLDAAVMVMALGEIPDDAHAFKCVFAALKPGGRLLVAESVFDPHYVRRRRVREKAQAPGFVEKDLAGNIFGYGIVFEKPRAADQPGGDDM